MVNAQSMTEGPDNVFQAVSDPNRRQLLDLLMHKAQAVQDLASHFDISLAAVSQHLKILLAAGLVSREVRGRFRIYRAQPRALKEIHDWAGQYHSFWEDRVVRLGEYLDKHDTPDGG